MNAGLNEKDHEYIRKNVMGYLEQFGEASRDIDQKVLLKEAGRSPLQELSGQKYTKTKDLHDQID